MFVLAAKFIIFFTGGMQHVLIGRWLLLQHAVPHNTTINIVQKVPNALYILHLLYSNSQHIFKRWIMSVKILIILYSTRDFFPYFDGAILSFLMFVRGNKVVWLSCAGCFMLFTLIHSWKNVLGIFSVFSVYSGSIFISAGKWSCEAFTAIN